MVDGDAPHTLAFIVSSVFKVLLTVCTQTLRSEANFAGECPEVRSAGLPCVHFPMSRWLFVSAVGLAVCVTPVLGEGLS